MCFGPFMIMSNVNTLFSIIIHIPLGVLMRANPHYYKINHHRIVIFIIYKVMKYRELLMK